MADSGRWRRTPFCAHSVARASEATPGSVPAYRCAHEGYGSTRSQHEPIEICRQRRMAIERENMRDILVRPHHDHAAGFPFDAAHRKNVVTALEVGAEHLFVIAKSVASFRREKERGHRLDGELRMRLLEHRAHIDH